MKLKMIKQPHRPSKRERQLKALATSMTDATYDMYVGMSGGYAVRYATVYRGHFMPMDVSTSRNYLKESMIKLIHNALVLLSYSDSFREEEHPIKQFMFTKSSFNDRNTQDLARMIVDALIEKKELQFIALNDELLKNGRKQLWMKK